MACWSAYTIFEMISFIAMHPCRMIANFGMLVESQNQFESFAKTSFKNKVVDQCLSITTHLLLLLFFLKELLEAPEHSLPSNLIHLVSVNFVNLAFQPCYVSLAVIFVFYNCYVLFRSTTCHT